MIPKPDKEFTERGRDWVQWNNVEAIGVTEKALRVKMGDHKPWVPKSQMHPKSITERKAVGDLITSQWWYEKVVEETRTKPSSQKAEQLSLGLGAKKIAPEKLPKREKKWNFEI